MEDLPPRRRRADGRWMKGCGSPNPKGRPPRNVEKEYLNVIISEVTHDVLRAITQRAIEDALKGDGKARDWIAKYAVGEPTTVHEYLVEKNQTVTIRVVFEKQGEIVDGEYEALDEGELDLLEAGEEVEDG